MLACWQYLIIKTGIIHGCRLAQGIRTSIHIFLSCKNTLCIILYRRLQIERDWDKSYNRRKNEEHTMGMMGALALATSV